MSPGVTRVNPHPVRGDLRTIHASPADVIVVSPVRTGRGQGSIPFSSTDKIVSRTSDAPVQRRWMVVSLVLSRCTTAPDGLPRASGALAHHAGWQVLSASLCMPVGDSVCRALTWAVVTMVVARAEGCSRTRRLEA